MINTFLHKISHQGKSDFTYNDIFAHKVLLAIFSMLIFLSTISLSGFFVTKMSANDYSKNTNGKMTIEFTSTEAHISALTDKQKHQVLNLLRATDGVSNVHVISDQDVKNIFDRVVPGVEVPNNMPLPMIFDIEFSDESKIDISKLSEKLSSVSNNVRIYDHSAINAPVIRLDIMFKIISICLAILSFAALSCGVYYLVNNIIIHNRDTVGIIKRLGASGKYIAQQLRIVYLKFGINACFISGFSSILFLMLLYNVLSLSEFTKYFVVCSCLSICIPVTIVFGMVLLFNIIVEPSVNNIDCTME